MGLFRFAVASAYILFLCLGAHAQTTAEKFGRMPETWDAQISPDGKHLALGCSPTGAMAICLFELDAESRPRLILPPDAGRIEGFYWASPDYLLYHVEVFDTIDTVDGLLDANIQRLIAYNLNSSKGQILMRNVGGFLSTTNMHSLLLNDPGKVLMGVSFRYESQKLTGSNVPRGNTGGHILYNVNLKSGKAKVSSTFSKKVIDTVHDAEGQRYAEIERDFGSDSFKVYSVIDDRKLVYEKRGSELAPFYVDGLDDDRRALIVSFDDGERYGLYRLSLDTGDISSVLYEGEPVGYVTTIDDRYTNSVIGYRYNDDLPGRVYLNEKFAKIAAFSRDVLGAERIILSSWTQDETLFTLATYNRGRPAQYFLYDVNGPSLSPIGGTAPWLDEVQLGTIETISYEARDGLAIPAYLTVPPGKSLEDGPLPLVVLPHGGPEARDSASYDWLAQAMASEGYLVLQPNFRGSSGYGAEFRDAGYGEFGGKMVTDVIDGADWVISQGFAEPGYCTLGWSYGGYSALMTALEDSDRVDCAVSINGVTEPTYVFDGTDKYSPARAYWENYIGDYYRLDDETRARTSPFKRAGEYRIPVLLLHGKEDTTVEMQQATSLHKALRGRSKLVLFDGDDHQLARTETRIQVLEESLDFLNTHHPSRKGN